MDTARFERSFTDFQAMRAALDIAMHNCEDILGDYHWLRHVITSTDIHYIEVVGDQIHFWGNTLTGNEKESGFFEGFVSLSVIQRYLDE